MVAPVRRATTLVALPDLHPALETDTGQVPKGGL
jgi:hypothetical protein